MENNFQMTESSFSSQGWSRAGRKVQTALLIGLFLFSILMIANSAGRGVAAALAPQEAMTGQWTAEVSKGKTDYLQLTLHRQTDKGRTSNMGSSMSFADFQGLTREQATSANANVSFRLVREAGTFQFEGNFRDGKGAGLWTLTPSQQFISAMRERGFENLSEEKLLSAAMIDVNTKMIDDMRAAGHTLSSIEDVFKVAIFKITPAYISELKAIGFDRLDLEDLVKARIFKITPEFAREVKEMGFHQDSLESLVKLRIFKITPEFARQMRSAGLENLSLEDLVKLRIHKVDTGFIERVKASGRADFGVEELIRLRIHGVIK
jgi:hypothetical protein